jgi:hypothetical protein
VNEDRPLTRRSVFGVLFAFLIFILVLPHSLSAGDSASLPSPADSFIEPKRPAHGPEIAARKAPGDELEEQRFQWRPALLQSGFFFGVQHSFRFATEAGTRAGLRGPFFPDWGESIRGYCGWKDGDPPIVNCVGHPLMGAVTGYIQAHNDPAGRGRQFGWNRGYWKSRMKATAWSTAYSLQFEFGPVSESSLDNVGQQRYIVGPLEDRTGNRVFKMLLRTALNPSRTFANALRLHVPWYRDTRGGVFGR